MNVRPAFVRIALVAASAAASATFCSPAHAELSSWFSVGVGDAKLQWAGTPRHDRLMLPVDVGFGLPPSLPIIAGIGVRETTYLGDGPDWGAYLRLTTRGYVTGGWGAALDAGGWFRTFAVGSTGLSGRLSIGVPFWGLFVAGEYAQGTNDAKNMAAFVGIDLLRLTVYRLSGEQRWPNVNPAWRPER